MGGGLRAAVDATVLAATAASVAAATAPVVGRRRPGVVRAPGAARSGRRSLLVHPGTWLGATVAAVLVNQVLFTVYVVRVHGGDPGFVARYLPDGWFDLPAGGPVGALARHVPAPWLLAPTVLRVQAVCELPFVVLAYLTACRWFDPALYRRLLRPLPLWLACASYTAVFCLVELSLPNPYTGQDVVLRAAAGLALPPLLGRLAVGEPAGEPARAAPPRSAAELVLFAAAAGALGQLVLAVYDTALLYNLGHLAARLPGAALALAVLAGARLTARHLARGIARRPDRARAGPGPGVATAAWSLRWFLLLFFAPALPLRYGLGFGSAPVAAAAGALLVLLAVGLGVRQAAGAGRWTGPRAVALRLSVLLAEGLAGAFAAGLSLSRPTRYPEAGLLRAAVLFVLAACLTCATADRLGAVRWRAEGTNVPPA